MNYSLSEIKIAAYNFQEPPGLSPRQRALWLGIAYCYDCFRAGEPQEACEALMEQFIKIFENKDVEL